MKNYTALVYEHLVPKSHYIQRPCEELASQGELTIDVVKERLEKYWRLATITKSEDAKLQRLAMPENWDGSNVFARYDAAGIELQPNPYYPANPAVG